jgi:dienelactone hydrolase
MNDFEGHAIAPSIEIKPESALVDEPLSIKLLNFEPNQSITVRARMSDDSGNEWESYALFKADTMGSVDVNRQSPRVGTYDDVDPMGLLWSMKPVSTTKMASNYIKKTLVPAVITFSAEVDGKPVISKKIERLYIAPGVERQPVREDGLVGTYFKPPLKDPQPGIIVLSGSEGRLREDLAALLASHGYATLALAYFRIETLPKELVNIPLEYFEKALQWMEAKESVLDGRLAVLGRSKGGELALLLGATIKQIKAVVAYAGSGVVFPGLRKDRRDKIVHSSWTYKGKEIPFVPLKMTFTSLARSIWAKIVRKPFSTEHLYAASLKDHAAVEKAIIKVEKINGPVLLISGKGDTVWPSPQLSQMAIDRLERHNHPYLHEHLSYKGAGHLIDFPYTPTTVNCQYNPSTGIILAYGGNPKENARARAESWSRVLTFFEQSLKG